jgi:uncharacterized protein (TIGR03118 family)
MPTPLSNFRRFSRVQRRRGQRLVLHLENLERRSMMDTALGFVVTNLASDIKGVAAHFDRDLMNPWSLVETADGRFRVSANNAGNSPRLTAAGTEVGRAVVIPAPSDSPSGSSGTPTGLVANSTKDFVISHGGHSAPASFIFSSEDGTIIGFNRKVDATQGVIGADLSDSDAVFKGLAFGVSGGNNLLYATDFHNGTVDVFDTNFNLVHLDGSFTDPNAPPPAIDQPGFAPFGIQNIDGTIFVTYALQKPGQHDDQEGAGNGFIDEFDTSGHFIKRFASGTGVGGTVTALNSPFGLAVAPDNFGPSGAFSNALLVGNFGDSHVSAFNIMTGAFLGQLSDTKGHPLSLNGGVGGSNTKGLWGIRFGNGHGGTARDALFFAAGINDEADGLFGKVKMTGGHHDHASHVGAQAAVTLASGSGPSLGFGETSVDRAGSAAGHENVAALKLVSGQFSTSIQADATAKSMRGGAREQQLLDMLLADEKLNLFL